MRDGDGPVDPAFAIVGLPQDDEAVRPISGSSTSGTRNLPTTGVLLPSSSSLRDSAPTGRPGRARDGLGVLDAARLLAAGGGIDM